MLPLKALAAAGVAATIGSLTAVSALAATPSPVVLPTAGHTQNVSITIRAGDRILESNFALAPGVPVRLTVRNFTHEFHTFMIPGLAVTALVRPSVGHTPRTTTVEFTPRVAGTFGWRCVICPTGKHGRSHEMGGAVYVLIDPSALP